MTAASPQKVALVCDWLTTPGGAEKVLLELHRMYPDAPIYTSQYRPKRISWFKDATVKTGWLNFLPAALRNFLGVFRQSYFSHLDLSGYDLVISVTGAEAKSVRTTSKDGQHHAHHLCYCHAPTQYYWGKYDQYLAHPGFGILNPLARLALRLLVRPLRRADFRAAQRVDRFLAPSTHSASEIKHFYHRSATVVFPPVDLHDFSYKPQKSQSPPAPFVISCRQAPWKRVDLAISACLAANQPLLVIGSGAAHSDLVKLAAGSPLITFLPWMPASELAEQLRSARAYLFPSIEPFGIAAVEAIAVGTPVIAFYAGGSRDIIISGTNGLFFRQQSAPALVAALQDFSKSPLSHPSQSLRRQIARSADRFSTENFRSAIQNVVRAAFQSGSQASKSTTESRES